MALAHRVERPGRAGRPSLRRRPGGCRRRRKYRPNPVVPQHTHTRAFQVSRNATARPIYPNDRRPVTQPTGKGELGATKLSVRPPRGRACAGVGGAPRCQCLTSEDAEMFLSQSATNASGRGQPVKGRLVPHTRTIAAHMVAPERSKRLVGGRRVGRQSGTRWQQHPPARPIGRPASCTHTVRDATARLPNWAKPLW